MAAKKEVEDRHPWASLVWWFPDDIFLRQAGYTIYARPKHGPAMWRDPLGQIVTQPQAIETAQTSNEIRVG